MASGSLITLTGGVSMRQVNAGDIISKADFNNARTNVDRLLGTSTDVTLGTYDAASTYGYGQGGAGVNSVSTGDLVYAEASATVGFKNLQDDIQEICLFLGRTPRSAVDKTSGDSITASDWNDLMQDVEDCWNNRFSPAARSLETDITTTRTAPWNNTLDYVYTWTFSNEDDCRKFFNLGGALGMGAELAPANDDDKNVLWSNMMQTMGDTFLYYNTSSNSVQSAGIGFYDLTTTNRELLTYTPGSATYASSYTNNFIKVFARVNSAANPTSVTMTYRMYDGDGVYGADVDEDVEGVLDVNGRRRAPNPNGTGFSVPVPTASS